MRRPYARLVAAGACAVATALFTGAALADPGNGNSANAPGQVKQAQPAAPAPAAPASVPAQSQSPGQAKKTVRIESQTQSSGQAKQAAKASSSSAGVKPASKTTHWTHCVTGTSSSGATCTSSDAGHTPQVKADVSKQYGNGKTAAQIAVSRGGVGVQLTGPGNSQPHKVTACGKPSNKSGGVDVHAIKSYDSAKCQAKVQAQVQAPVVQTPVATCGFTVVAQQSVLGVMHVNGKGRDVHLMTNAHSAHFQGKHADDHLVVGTTSTLQPDTTQVCGQQQSQAVQAQVQQVTPAAPVVPVAPAAQAQSQAPATQQSQSQASAAAPASSNGGVLGANTTLASPKPASHHGVLGTVARVAGSSLPFTGFPVWAAMLIALALIGGGMLLRRRTASARI